MALSTLTVCEIQNNHNNLLYEAFEKYGRWSWWISLKHPSTNPLKNKLLLASDFLYSSEEEAIKNAKNVVQQILKYDLLNDSPDNKKKFKKDREKQEDLEREQLERDAWLKKNKK